MKIYLALVLLGCTLAAAAPSEKAQPPIPINFVNEVSPAQNRNVLVNILVNQLFNYLRHVINNGSIIFDIPPLDPLVLKDYHLNVPAGIINLDLLLKNARVTGLGEFTVKKSDLDLRTLTFDVEIAFPKIDIAAEEYDLTGDLYGAIPLFGKGKAHFVVDGFVFSSRSFLKQSEDGQSIIIDRIEGARFDIPSLKSDLKGVIGGGDIDAVVNAIIEDVALSYINRFQAAIASLTSQVVVQFGNPLLESLDTWRFIAPFLPNNA